MTAKEKLLDRVMKLSEAEAEGTLRLLEDPVVATFRDAPEDDEPWTEEDEAAAAEADADFAAGRTVSHEEIKREFGSARLSSSPSRVPAEGSSASGDVRAHGFESATGACSSSWTRQAT